MAGTTSLLSSFSFFFFFLVHSLLKLILSELILHDILRFCISYHEATCELNRALIYRQMRGLHFRRADTSYSRCDLLIPAKQNSQHRLQLHLSETRHKQMEDGRVIGMLWKIGRLRRWIRGQLPSRQRIRI